MLPVVWPVGPHLRDSGKVQKVSSEADGMVLTPHVVWLHSLTLLTVGLWDPLQGRYYWDLGIVLIQVYQAKEYALSSVF